MPVVLHPLEQGLDRLGSEVQPLLGAGERVGLVDEEDTVERATDRAVRLDRRQADELADEPGAVDLDEVALPQEPHRAVHLREQARDGRLARARVPEEHEVLRGRHFGQVVLGARGLHLEEGDERSHLLLDRVQADEGVELGLELVQRGARLGLAQRVELVGQPVRAVAAARPHA